MILASNNIAVLYEAILKSAPQFIIELNAMVAQRKSVKVVQTVSLPVSFLCLVWASTVADDVIHGKEEDSTVNYMAHETNKPELFLTHFLVLSSRLFAIPLFTVSFKWWITTVLSFHSIAIVICDVSLFYPRGECDVTFASFVCFLFQLPLVARSPDNENRPWVISRKEKEGVEKNADVLQRVVCDRKHHHDLVLFQSVPSYLVRSPRHSLRRFFCSLRSRRLEVVGERENGRMRWRHARGEGTPARKAPENRFNSHYVRADISNWSRGSLGKTLSRGARKLSINNTWTT